VTNAGALVGGAGAATGGAGAVKESPIFARAYDRRQCLLRVTEHF